MPQANKKRGRRMQDKKRQRDEEDVQVEQSSKRRKSEAQKDDVDADDTAPTMDDHQDSMNEAYPPTERPFFGLLDEEEQDHFRNASDMLEANTFDSAEDKEQFLVSLYREAEGKELKLAQSQSCSRLMERLIQLSTAAQLKTLFQRLSGK